MSKLIQAGRLHVLTAIAAAALMLTSFGAGAQQTCDEVRVSGAPRFHVTDTYNTFAPTDLTELTSMTIVNAGDEPCPLAIALTAPNDGELRSSGETLSYTLETPSGAPLLNPPNLADPQAGHHLSLMLGAGQSGSVNLRARIPAGQSSAPGTYTDNAIRVQLYHTPDGGFASRLSETSFPVSVDVARVCQLAPPQPSELDFTSDIGSDARPKGGWRQIRLPGAACNTGSRMKLRASALSRETHGTAPGLDGVIDLEAIARLRSVTVMLLTNGAQQPVEAISPQIEHDGIQKPVDVQIRLRAGQPLAPGSYESVLTITLEPAS